MSKVWYGSLQNRLQELAVVGQPEPIVGMGATILSYSDRSPVTIIGVTKMSNGRFMIEVQDDLYTRTDNNGMSDSQDYVYSRNPDGGRSHYRQNAKGIWQQVVKNQQTGKWNKVDTGGLRIGERDRHYDFSF